MKTNQTIKKQFRLSPQVDNLTGLTALLKVHIKDILLVNSAP